MSCYENKTDVLLECTNAHSKNILPGISINISKTIFQSPFGSIVITSVFTLPVICHLIHVSYVLNLKYNLAVVLWISRCLVKDAFTVFRALWFWKGSLISEFQILKVIQKQTKKPPSKQRAYYEIATGSPSYTVRLNNFFPCDSKLIMSHLCS